jgi:nitronate monooxygenase
MAKDPELLDLALAHKPVAMMLSFSDPEPFAEKIRAAGVPLICQVHKLDHARRALDVGASVIVVQGTDAGGHGLTTRGTITLVPNVVDLVARERPDVLVLAAGGIADGRGIAAALMLGADVHAPKLRWLCASCGRFWIGSKRLYEGAGDSLRLSGRWSRQLR